MNERIRQLERQAMISVLNGNDPDGDVDGMYISAEFTKKFAEMIVRECIDVIGEDNYTMLTGKAYCTELKRHFGVKE